MVSGILHSRDLFGGRKCTKSRYIPIKAIVNGICFPSKPSVKPVLRTWWAAVLHHPALRQECIPDSGELGIVQETCRVLPFVKHPAAL